MSPFKVGIRWLPRGPEWALVPFESDPRPIGGDRGVHRDFQIDVNWTWMLSLADV